MNATATEPDRLQVFPRCPCGQPGTHWIGSYLASCDPCSEKDRIYHEGLKKFYAFHLLREKENQYETHTCH
jgi:hypothetical protein